MTTGNQSRVKSHTRLLHCVTPLRVTHDSLWPSLCLRSILTVTERETLMNTQEHLVSTAAINRAVAELARRYPTMPMKEGSPVIQGIIWEVVTRASIDRSIDSIVYEVFELPSIREELPPWE